MKRINILWAALASSFALNAHAQTLINDPYRSPRLHFDAYNITHKCQNTGTIWGWMPASLDSNITDHITQGAASYNLKIFWELDKKTGRIKANMYTTETVDDHRLDEVGAELWRVLGKLCAQKNPTKPVFKGRTKPHIPKGNPSSVPA